MGLAGPSEHWQLQGNTPHGVSHPTEDAPEGTAPYAGGSPLFKARARAGSYLRERLGCRTLKALGCRLLQLHPD